MLLKKDQVSVCIADTPVHGNCFGMSSLHFVAGEDGVWCFSSLLLTSKCLITVASNLTQPLPSQTAWGKFSKFPKSRFPPCKLELLTALTLRVRSCMLRAEIVAGPQ